MVGTGIRYEVRLDDVTIGDLGTKEYVVAYVVPGKYKMTVHAYGSIVAKSLAGTQPVNLAADPRVAFYEVSAFGETLARKAASDLLAFLPGMPMSNEVLFQDLVSDPTKLAEMQRARREADAAQAQSAAQQRSQTMMMGGITPGLGAAVSGKPAGATAAATGGGNCPATLAHLAPNLPQYNDAQLQQLRQASLAIDMRDTLEGVKAQGFTASQAAAEAARVSKATEAELSAAAQCLNAFGVEPEKLAAQLQNGSFEFADSANSNCARGYVVAYYSSVVNKEAAVILACMARQGQ